MFFFFLQILVIAAICCIVLDVIMCAPAPTVVNEKAVAIPREDLEGAASGYGFGYGGYGGYPLYGGYGTYYGGHYPYLGGYGYGYGMFFCFIRSGLEVFNIIVSFYVLLGYPYYGFGGHSYYGGWW